MNEKPLAVLFNRKFYSHEFALEYMEQNELPYDYEHTNELSYQFILSTIDNECFDCLSTVQFENGILAIYLNPQ